MKNSDSSDEKEKEKCPFAVYRAEADALFRSGKYTKAIKCYTQALELDPTHEHCLVARSRCYLLEGQMDKALEDADASLGGNNKNPKGLFQKAEVYYFQSEFEKALILYHRGHKLRPEMEAFRLGIQKSEEAINNSVGDPETIKLRLDCDLSYFFLNTEKKNERIIKKMQTQDENRLERKPCNTDSKTVKQLLGELYSDREFLEKLLNEEDSLANKTKNSKEIRHLVVKGLNYLDERSDFWQQQKPMYARKKYQYKKSKSCKTKQQKDIIKYVVSSLDEIDTKQTRGEHRKAIKQSESLIKQIDQWSENDLPDRLDILANLYCLIGNSYLEMENYEKALEYHEKDKELGKKHDIEESLSRSIDNIGRVHAKQKQYNKAIEIWKEKIPMSKSALESTWLHHEMGRCYLELDEYDAAIEYGEKSIDFAREAEDDTWQMNASILVAQAATKCKKYNFAIEHFERALDYSKMMKNVSAEEAIKKAIEEVNQKIINEDTENRHKESDSERAQQSEKSKELETNRESSPRDSEKSKGRKHSKSEGREEEETNREASPIRDEEVTKKEESGVENTDKSERADIKESPKDSRLTQDVSEDVTNNDITEATESPKENSGDNLQSNSENNNVTNEESANTEPDKVENVNIEKTDSAPTETQDPE